MDSSAYSVPCKEPELSAEDVGSAVRELAANPASSPNSTPGSKNKTSLDNHPKKKVGQSAVRGCKKPLTLYFVCKNGHVVTRKIRCHKRFIRECPYCGSKWRKITVERYKKIISEMLRPKHVVLTLRKGGRHKLEELSRLVQRCRKYVRRQGYRIRSFVFCIEPPNHVHAVWDCDYIPRNGLINIWRTITGDSFEVYIRYIGRHRWKKAVNYITKYITKINKSGSGMRGMHVIGSWGNPKTKIVRMICKKCGSFFHPLWDLSYSVDKDTEVDFVEIDPG